MKRARGWQEQQQQQRRLFSLFSLLLLWRGRCFTPAAPQKSSLNGDKGGSDTSSRVSSRRGEKTFRHSSSDRRRVRHSSGGSILFGGSASSSSSRSSSGSRDSDGGVSSSAAETQRPIFSGDCNTPLRLEKKAYVMTELGLSQAEWDAMARLKVYDASLDKTRAVVGTMLVELEGATRRKVGVLLPRVLRPSLNKSKGRLERLKRRGITPEFGKHASAVFGERTDDQFDKWLAKQPSPEEEQFWEEKRRWFVEELGVSQARWARLLQHHDTKRRLEVTTFAELQSLVFLLMREMEGADPMSVGVAVLECPELGPALEATVKQRLGSFKGQQQQQQQQQEEEEKEEGAARPVWGVDWTDLFVAHNAAAVLTRTRLQASDTRLQAKKDWFQTELFLLEHEWEGLMQSPSRRRRMQSVSLDKMQSIAKLLLQEMEGATPRQVGLRLPRLLSGNSVEGTMAGRLSQLKKQGIRPVLSKHARPLTHGTESSFKAWLKRQKKKKRKKKERAKESPWQKEERTKRSWFLSELGLSESDWDEMTANSSTSNRKKLASTKLDDIKQLVAVLMEHVEAQGCKPRDIGLEVGAYGGRYFDLSVEGVVKPRLARLGAMGIQPLRLEPHARAACTLSASQFEKWLSDTVGEEGLMKEKMGWFERALGLTEAETLQIFCTARQRSVLTKVKIAKLQALLELMSEEMEGATPREVGMYLPRLLAAGSSVEAMRGKLAQLKKQGIRPVLSEHARPVSQLSASSFKAWLKRENKDRRTKEGREEADMGRTTKKRKGTASRKRRSTKAKPSRPLEAQIASSAVIDPPSQATAAAAAVGDTPAAPPSIPPTAVSKAPPPTPTPAPGWGGDVFARAWAWFTSLWS